jgi:hypothetical protein
VRPPWNVHVHFWRRAAGQLSGVEPLCRELSGSRRPDVLVGDLSGLTGSCFDELSGSGGADVLAGELSGLTSRAGGRG